MPYCQRPATDDRLRRIAPTYVFDIATADDFDVYAKLAELTGRGDRLPALEARYEAQFDLIRSQVDTDALRVSVIQGHDGELLVWNPYGTLGKVLRDAGFEFPEIVDAIEDNQRRTFSAEMLPRFDADMIFVTYRADRSRRDGGRCQGRSGKRSAVMVRSTACLPREPGRLPAALPGIDRDL